MMDLESNNNKNDEHVSLCCFHVFEETQFINITGCSQQ